MHILGGENLTAPFLQPVTLQCVGTGVPTPSIRWWKDGVAMATSGGRLQVQLETQGCLSDSSSVEVLETLSRVFAGGWNNGALSRCTLNRPLGATPGDWREPLAWSRPQATRGKRQR